jgi:hypothetical protein
MHMYRIFLSSLSSSRLSPSFLIPAPAPILTYNQKRCRVHFASFRIKEHDDVDDVCDFTWPRVCAIRIHTHTLMHTRRLNQKKRKAERDAYDDVFLRCRFLECLGTSKGDTRWCRGGPDKGVWRHYYTSPMSCARPFIPPPSSSSSTDRPFLSPHRPIAE